jgi:DNA-binding CsgD family transcriptional regulator
VVLTTFELDEYVFEALRAGASGFLLKDIDPADLRQAVRVVAGGDALLSPAVTRTLIQEFVARPARQSVAPERLSALTDREREVMALVAEGLTNDEIGQRLFMSPATARTHVSRAMVKLGRATAPNWWSSPTRAGWSPAPDRDARPPRTSSCVTEPSRLDGRRRNASSIGSEGLPTSDPEEAPMASTNRTVTSELAQPRAGSGGGVAALFFAQAALAGQFLNGNQGALNLHAANAEIIPLVTIAQLVVAIRVWRRRKVAWPTAAAALLLVAIVFQVGFGYGRQLALHIPLGVAIFGTTLWLLIGTRRLWRDRHA